MMFADGPTISPMDELAANYLAGRQCPDGGFCYYRSWGIDESNPADTFAAIQSFALLNRNVTKSNTVIGWLHGFQTEDGGFPSFNIGFFTLASLLWLDVSPRVDPTNWLSMQSQRISQPRDTLQSFDEGSLCEIARFLFMCGLYAVAIDARMREVIEAQVLPALPGKYQRGDLNLITIYLASLTLSLAGKSFELAHVADYLLRCADQNYGFISVPGSTATSMTTVAAGVSLSLLLRIDMPPGLQSALMTFVSSCQSGVGGFGRLPGAVPTLQDTRSALYVLRNALNGNPGSKANTRSAAKVDKKLCKAILRGLLLLW
jgi:hypothetical protein